MGKLPKGRPVRTVRRLQNLVPMIAARGVARLRRLAPTRSAIVVSAFLLLVFLLSYLAAFFIRGELLIQAAAARQITLTIWWVACTKLTVFYVAGCCHRSLHRARFSDLNLLLRTTTLAMLVVAAVNFFAAAAPGWIPIPRSVLLLDWLGTIFMVGGVQAGLRSLFEEILPTMPSGGQISVLVVDASEAGRRLAFALKDQETPRYFVAGLLDDDPAHYGVHVGSARVLGPIGVAPACAERLRVKQIVVLEGVVFGQQLRSLCEACSEIDVPVRIGSLSPVGEVLEIRGVELRDLLSRPQVRLSEGDADVRPLLAGSTVLITGAGGSIGSEICRQVARFQPKRLVLVERSEAALFSILQRLRDEGVVAEEAMRPVLLDITNLGRTARLLAEERPEVVVHAAAFKHLPLMEEHPAEAVENNALATASLADLAAEHAVGTFVALSTDKAVNPSSVMGASKLFAERYLQGKAAESNTRFVVVRFGNVLASSGSAVPIFESRLRDGREIVVTDPDVRRFFMTIDEAAQLVLVAAATGDGGGTYVLDMGEPIRIVDLVHSLAYVMEIPQSRVAIRYIGLRPGEKLDEELFFADEQQEPTRHSLVLGATRSSASLGAIQRWRIDLERAVADDTGKAGELLMEFARLESEAAGGRTQEAGDAVVKSADSGVAEEAVR